MEPLFRIAIDMNIILGWAVYVSLLIGLFSLFSERYRKKLKYAIYLLLLCNCVFFASAFFKSELCQKMIANSKIQGSPTQLSYDRFIKTIDLFDMEIIVVAKK